MPRNSKILKLILLSYFMFYPVWDAHAIRLLRILTSPDPRVGGFFGWSVTIVDNLIVIRDARDPPDEPLNRAQVYMYDAETLDLKEILECPNPREGAYSFYATVLDREIVVVAKHWESFRGMENAGKVYVYDAESLELLAVLTSPEPLVNGFFGWSIAVTQNLLIISELKGLIDGTIRAGRVYVYDKNTLNLRGILTSPDPQPENGFGGSVSASDDIIVVGEAWADIGRLWDAGRAYVYDAESLELLAVLTSPEPQYGSFFGYSVAVSSNLIVVGEPKASVGEIGRAGRVYVYDLTELSRSSSVSYGIENPAVLYLLIIALVLVFILFKSYFNELLVWINERKKA